MIVGLLCSLSTEHMLMLTRALATFMREKFKPFFFVKNILVSKEF